MNSVCLLKKSSVIYAIPVPNSLKSAFVTVFSCYNLCKFVSMNYASTCICTYVCIRLCALLISFIKTTSVTNVMKNVPMPRLIRTITYLRACNTALDFRKFNFWNVQAAPKPSNSQDESSWTSARPELVQSSNAPVRSVGITIMTSVVCWFISWQRRVTRTRFQIFTFRHWPVS